MSLPAQWRESSIVHQPRPTDIHKWSNPVSREIMACMAHRGPAVVPYRLGLMLAEHRKQRTDKAKSCCLPTSAITEMGRDMQPEQGCRASAAAPVLADTGAEPKQRQLTRASSL
jgi:hypothetical protein